MRLRMSVLVFVVMGAARLEAQSSSSLPHFTPGTRLRIDAPGVVAPRFVGTLLLPATDSLLLAAPDGPPITIRPAQITSLEVSRGRSRLVSGAIGMLLVGSVGFAVGHDYSRDPEQ